ncbi:50S ribosomal protein L28, chloroplastic [Eucalyptus grandis]|uniref:50S ribosomal protein L28, chloroplastic n=1 Tax=Eucalyptus grandis TaxID=71139 RepID=UPI00192F023B|nr:50S ribosomal protein L28, chloroplastic [Eucalyptus grandis]
MATVAPGASLGNACSLHFRNTHFSRTALAPPRARASSEIGFLASQLSGLRVSYDDSRRFAGPVAAPATAVQPVARRICPFTGKKANRANKVSFSNHKTKKLQFVNLQYKRIWWEAGKRYVKLRLSTKALKTIEKNGLDAVAKKAGIDLRKE